MKKTFLAGILSATLIFGNSSAESARYFMQGDKIGSSTPYGENLRGGNYVQSGDAKIYCEIYGKGDPILILHGGGVGSPYELGKILDELKKTHKLIVMWSRGHGKSEIGHSPISFEQKIDDVLAVLDKITQKPVQILGFSDGAYTAYEFAAKYPERVEKIVAIGAGTLEAGYFPAEIDFSALEGLDEEFFAAQKKIRPESERWEEFMVDYMKFWNKQSIGAEIFGKIKCPVLLIVGDEDDHAPIATVLAAHQILANSRLCVVPKAWHSAFLDNFDVTWAAIRQFVNSPPEKLISSKKIAYNTK